MLDTLEKFLYFRACEHSSVGLNEVGPKEAVPPEFQETRAKQAEIAVREAQMQIVTYEEARPILDELDLPEEAKADIFNCLVLLGHILADREFGLLPEQKIMALREGDSIPKRGNRVFSKGYPKSHFKRAASPRTERTSEDS